MNRLVDPFGREIEYLRLSVTDKCDLRCFYCLPKGFKDFKQPDTWLTFDEIERIVGIFGELGVSRIRLTGGEPLVRNDLALLAGRLSQLPGIDDLSLSTNAVRLEKHAADLFAAGVRRLNISLDTLNPERFREISGGKLEKVLAGLMAAKQAGFSPIKINTVLMKGINDHEVDDLVDFCIEHGFTLRLIETMPIGDTGRNASEYYIDLDDIRRTLSQRFDLLPTVMSGGGPARYVAVGDTGVNIGFITPMSQHFCETCNRVRLSAQGDLYLCLGQEDKVSLRPMLRRGISDDELREEIVSAIARKPERHDFCEQPAQVVRFMSETGG